MYMHTQWNIVYVYIYIFFIHSTVHGHLGGFHVLAIINSASVNIGMHVSFQIMVSFEYKPRSTLLDHMATLFLIFKEPSYYSR